MAYLRIKQRGTRRYVYIMESRRRGDKVNSKILQFLGREDEIDPRELQRALTYWRVRPKSTKRKAKRK